MLLSTFHNSGIKCFNKYSLQNKGCIIVTIGQYLLGVGGEE